MRRSATALQAAAALVLALGASPIAAQVSFSPDVGFSPITSSPFPFSPFPATPGFDDASLTCKNNDDAVAGPFVTPTSQNPAFCNGLPCPAVCTPTFIPLPTGALLAESQPFTCPGPFNCFGPAVLITASSTLSKTFIIEGIPVGSILDYSVNSFIPLGAVPPQTTRTAKIFGYTSTWFLCQNPDGTCPVDTESQAPGFPFPSPFAQFFDGVCSTDANGFYNVCVYACVRGKVVICDEPAGPGPVININPIVSVSDTPIDVESLTFGFNIPPPLSDSALSCKTTDDALIVAGPFVSPTVTFPSLCNGVPCDDVCGIPGGQKGALIAQSEPFTCNVQPNCFGNLFFVSGTKTITKATTVAGVTVGSTGTFSVNQPVLVAQQLAQGTTTTVAVYAWETVWFKCQLPNGGCPADSESINPGFPVASPFDQFFDGICPTDSNGFYRVCVYACINTETVVCISSTDSVPPGVGIQVQPFPVPVDIENFSLGFPPFPPALVPSSLQCKPSNDPTVVFGPLVSPIVGELPATCNGVPCPEICNVPGAQLGAPVAFGTPIPCPDNQLVCTLLSQISVEDFKLVKGTNVDGFLVGSTVTISLAANLPLSNIPGGSTAQSVAYVWDTVYFKCQNDDGTCPFDASADAPGLPISSPFNVFSNQCDTDANGFFQVCVYICVTTKIATCITGPHGVTIGTIFDDDLFQTQVSVSPSFPPQPPSLMPAALDCTPPNFPGVVLGPLVSPTLMPLPPGLPVVVSTKCNGADCPPVCGVPGAQLGALLLSSAPATCSFSTGCGSVEVSIPNSEVTLDKAVTVDDFVVGSSSFISIPGQTFEVGPLEPGDTAVVEIYAYTTILFTCQTNGQCPAADQDGILGVQAVSSPFDVFDGICDSDAQGFFQVCILAAVKTVAVECISDGFSHPKFDVIETLFTEIQFEFGFPPPPPDLMFDSIACASPANGIVLGPLVSPSLMALPPGAPEVISSVCNGIDCGPVCGIPGAQLGALIGVSDTFECTGPGTCVGATLTVAGSMVPLDKALNVAGFVVGSTADLTFSQTEKISDLPSGSHATLKAYAWTSVFFRCQLPTGACPFDPQSLVPGLAVSSPFTAFEGICDTDTNGFYEVCVYACLELKTVECLSDINGTPSLTIGDIDDLDADIENFMLGFPPPPPELSAEELSCLPDSALTDTGIVFGPLVSPTLDEVLPAGSPPLLSTVCNGLPCPSVCDVPGAQLGALVGISETFTCNGPGDCVDNEIPLEFEDVPLEKAVVVGAGSGFTVGSSASLSFKADVGVKTIPSGSSVTINAYAYTTIYFRCQTSPGVCPADSASDAAPLAVQSPFPFFNGKCPTDSNGFFEVCLYACVNVVAVECISGGLGFPSVTVGEVSEIDFTVDSLVLGFPSPPPGLTLPDITCPVPSGGVVFGPLVSPSLQPLPDAPPVLTTQCNGVACSTVCGIPGGQLGAIVAASDTFECMGPGPCSPTLMVSGSTIPIEKAVNVGGFNVGSSTEISFSDSITVSSLPPGAHATIEVYQYTTLWFTCQSIFGCPGTVLADGPPLAISSPFDVFEGLCSSDSNGFFNVCLYASAKLKAVECLSDVFGIPSVTVGTVTDIVPDSLSLTLGFPPIPPSLQPSALSCQAPSSNIVFGPLVSPTLTPAPPTGPPVISTTCNGLPCPSVCGIIGNQLGALVGQSDTFVCQGPGPCSPTLTVSGTDVPLEKSINVGGSVVGSTAVLSFSDAVNVQIPSGSHVTVDAYAYTTVSFRCQNPDGTCPPSLGAGGTVVMPFLSPFDVFDGICDTDPNGFYEVCIYACLSLVAVPCISDITGVVSVVDADAVDLSFTTSEFFLGFPAPPPGLQTPDLVCVNSAISTDIVFGPLVSPSLQPVPAGSPVLVSTQCNGLPCPEVCDIPGAQLGALIAESPTFECIGPGTCSPVLSISAIDVPLNKAVTVGAFTVGSTSSVFLDESVVVQIPSGSHATLKAYAYTSVYFKCQDVLGQCPPDAFTLTPGVPIDSPFSVFEGICPTDANGFYQVCVYACVDVKAVTCLSDVNGVPAISIGEIFDFTLTVFNFVLDFPPTPPLLSPFFLSCVFPSPTIVFGPLVSPNTQPLPPGAPEVISTTCNGLPCPEVCGIGGAPPGALIAVSDTFTCAGPGMCSPSILVTATDVELTKAVNVAGFTVGSSASLSFSQSVFLPSIPSGSSATIEAYAYTTIYFRCQDDDGSCPADPSSEFTPLPISSPFDVFEDICKTDMDGKFRVCLYACVRVVAVACLEDTLDVPTKTIGPVSSVFPVTVDDPILGFPPLPPELMASALSHISPNPAIVLGPLVSPTIEPIPGPAPPVLSSFCNGLPCPTVCDLPGQQLGALVAVSDSFTCLGPAPCSPTLNVFGDGVSLEKALTVDGFVVGSSAVLSFDEDVTVTGLPSGASVTLNTYAYTSVFFQCQLPNGACPINADSDTPPLAVASPFPVFDGICNSDENGFFEVCLYGSIKIVSVECISDIDGVPGVSVGAVEEQPLDVNSFFLDFPPPPTPLSPQALSCVSNFVGVVLGPLISPSTQEIPPGAPDLISTVCNGVACSTVCDIPGGQLGAELATSETFECQGPGSCTPTLNVFAQDFPLDKAVTVDGFVVGSTASISFNQDVTTTIPSGSHVTVNAYAYTSVYFRCQTPTNLCPLDLGSQAPPLAISSPFSVFEGVCDTDANGFYKVCLYACVRVIAVSCVSDAFGVPSVTIGGTIDAVSTTVSDFVLDFAAPPPGLTIPDLIVQPNPIGVVFGPVVSPTISNLPPGAPVLISTTCNGVACSEVCGIPGVQLGALVGQSETFDCVGPGPCSPTLSVSATAQPLIKSVDVAGFTVGSTAFLTYSTNIAVSSIPSGSSVTVDVYAYTTLYFRCQTATGGCPADAASTAPPLAIASPFDVFEGLCPTDPNGFYSVCLYAALKTVAVECISDLNGTPSVSIGDVDEIPTITGKFMLSLPPQPPGLMASDLLCANANDPTIVFGAPQLISTLCNGLPCPNVCGIPGVQLGAFLGSSSTFVCHGPGDCNKALTVAGADVALDKAVNVAGFDVGSTSLVSFSETVQVNNLPAGAGVTVEAYGYTSIYFRCQNDDGSCPADLTSDATPLPISSPFSVFEDVCKTDANGFYLVCLYACVKVVTVECIDDVNGLSSKTVGSVSMANSATSTVTLGFPAPPPGLMASDLSCTSVFTPGVVFGPVVSPTLMPPPPNSPVVVSTLCNGVECGPVCGIPGNQLGALLAVSETFECSGPGTCNGKVLTIQADNVPLTKAVTVDTFTVGSFADVSISESISVTIPSGSHVTLEAYAYTTLFFRCQLNGGGCPADPNSDVTPLEVLSPFGSVFNGVCNTNSQGLFQVCLYACLKVVAVECISDVDGIPSLTTGTVTEINPDVNTFTLGFPSPPAGLQTPELLCKQPDPTIAFGPVVSPSIMEVTTGPPIATATCNGVPCPPVCGLPGAQLGGLIAKSDVFECMGPGTCTPTLTISASGVPLTKSLSVGGFDVGSFGTYDLSESISVSLEPGQHAFAEAQVYTSVWFRCQSGGGCPIDPDSEAAPFPVDSPFGSVFSGICPPNSNGFFPVCVYACTTVKLVECTSDVFGITIGDVVDTTVEPTSFALGAPPPPPPLSFPFLACKPQAFNDIVFTVSPTLTFPDALCNGVTCDSICGIPGAQLGAFLAASDPFTCTGPGPCSPMLTIEEDDVFLNKAFFVGGFTVGSQSSVDLSTTQTVSVPSGATATLTAYQWTTVNFKCQTAFGTCPPDINTLVPGEAISSPFSEFFDGICPSNPDGSFAVCIYACISVKTVVCFSDALGIPSTTLGPVNTILPTDVKFGFGFPSPPPGLTTADLACVSAGSVNGLVAGPFTSPTQEFPGTCNGVPCQDVCGLPGGQLGALIGSTSTFECPSTGGVCHAPTLAFEVTQFSLDKSVSVGGFDVGSSSVISTSGVVTLGDLEPGSHATVNLYAYTTVFFKCQVLLGPIGSSNFGCLPDPNSIVPGLPVSSPLSQFFTNSNCPIDSNGNTLVCVYACVSVKAVECLSDANNTPGISIGEVTDVNADVIFEFEQSGPPDLSCSNAVTGQNGVVFGPVVSPTIPFPADCDGVPCGPICEIPGGELGGLITSSDVFECLPPNFGGCPTTLTIEVIGEVLVKEVDVEAFTVGSTTKVSSPPLTIDTVVPVGSSAQYNLYAWSTTFFRCGIPQAMDFSEFICLSDASALAVQPVFSPLASFFDGVCPQAPNGTFIVCVYACQQLEAVLCNTNSAGVPSIVSFNEVDPLITFDIFEFGVPDLVLSYGQPTLVAGGSISVPVFYRVISPIFGYQVAFTGPFPIAVEGGASEAANFVVQFSPIFNLFLGIDLGGGSIVEVDGAPSLLFNIVFDQSATGMEFCFLTSDLSIQTVFSAAGGVQLIDLFDGNNCIILDTPPCTTAGTGDVTLDGIINIQDVVLLLSFIVDLGPPSDPCLFLTADVFVDGVLNIQDVVALAGIITG